MEKVLEEALKHETMFSSSKNFADMTPKHQPEYRIRKDKVEGNLLPQNKLSSEESLRIVVRDPQIRDEGFFIGKHLSFMVETRPLGWVVERRDKDFNVLRDYLVKAFPQILIPAVPTFQSSKSMDKAFTRKRESLLNRFVNKLMIQEDLKACPVVLDFLSYEDSKAFTKQLKQSHDSAPKLRYIHEYASASGYSKFNMSKKIEVFSDQYEKYLTSHEILFKKFHYLGRKLSSDLMEVAKTLDSLSICSKNLSTMYQIGNSKEMGEIYENLHLHFKKWSKDSHNQAKINLRYLPQYFNYSALEHQSYKDLFEKRNKIINKFLTKDNDLQVKKEKLFKAGKPEKWELKEEDMKMSLDLLQDKEKAFSIMLPDSTKQVDDYEKTYIYLSSQCYKQIKKFNKEEVEDLKDHLTDYSTRMSETLTSQQLNWASFEEIVRDNSEEDSIEDSKDHT